MSKILSTIGFGPQAISDKGLDELNYYRYSGLDRSWLSYYVMQPFWNWLINYMPLNVAPNVITLVGFVGMIFSTIYAISCNPTFTEPLPPHAIMMVLVLVFLYQTLDALDGKQARRTKNSTPLGQLFDHGCDAVSMCCFAMMGGMIVRSEIGNPFFLVFFFSSLIAFYFAQWEEYWTGTIDLGEVGVTEGQCLGMGLYVYAFFYTSEAFTTHAFTFMGRNVLIGDLTLSVFSSAFIGTTFQNIYRVNKATETWSKKREAILQLFPVCSLTLSFLAWIKYSPANIIVTNPIYLLVAAGIFFPACVERMVVSRLTKDPVPYVYGFTFPVFAGLFNALVLKNAEHDVYLIRTCAVVAILAYLHFAYVVIHQITTYFDIEPFLINRPLQWPLKERKAKKAPASPRGRRKTVEKKETKKAPARAKSKSRSPRRTRSSSRRRK